MKKFKKFAKSRWHSIPLGAIALALIASMAITGSAYAAVTLLSGTASITVNEAIIITKVYPTDGEWATDTKTWTVPTYPGETKILTFKVENSGSVGIPVTVAITETASETETASDYFTETIKVSDNKVTWNDYSTPYEVVGTKYIQFTVTSSTSCPDGAYSFTIGITR
jgi:hypothetical protein